MIKQEALKIQKEFIRLEALKRSKHRKTKTGCKTQGCTSPVAETSFTTFDVGSNFLPSLKKSTQVSAGEFSLKKKGKNHQHLESIKKIYNFKDYRQ